MNTENLKYLKDALKYHGFGEKLYPELEQNMSAGLANFQLRFAESVNGKAFEGLLNFRKGDLGDMYYFNSYTAKLDRGIKENVEQTFYINKGRGVTAKEAYNLLDGRSVYKELTNKEGVSYQAWLQLDPKLTDKNGNHILKQYHANYGFELGKALTGLPVKELGTNEDRLKLMRSLEKGNVQSVTFERNGKLERGFIEANPQYKTLTVYDGNMKRMQKNEEKKVSTGEIKEEKKTEQKTSQTTLPDKSSVKKERKAKAASGLMPKRKVSSKKGLTQ